MSKEPDVAVKILMSWDIAPGREQEYFEFVVREFLPGVQQLGFSLDGAWATVYGDHPQILVDAILSDQREAEKLMHSDKWQSLFGQLQDFIINYSIKIVPARDSFQF
jgi:hypothetical protein